MNLSPVWALSNDHLSCSRKVNAGRATGQFAMAVKAYQKYPVMKASLSRQSLWPPVLLHLGQVRRSRISPEPPKTGSGQHLGLRADVSRSLTSCSPAALTQMDQALLKCHEYPCLPGEMQISLITCHGQEHTHKDAEKTFNEPYSQV